MGLTTVQRYCAACDLFNLKNLMIYELINYLSECAVLLFMTYFLMFCTFVKIVTYDMKCFFVKVCETR